MTVNTAEISKLVQEAESAVAAVKDPDLKRTAFEKVLDALLAGGGGGSTPKKAIDHERGAAARARTGPQARVDEMIEAGFFKKPQAFKAIMEELEARGHHLPRTSLSPTLLALCRAKRLRRRKVEGAWQYSNW